MCAAQPSILAPGLLPECSGAAAQCQLFNTFRKLCSDMQEKVCETAVFSKRGIHLEMSWSYTSPEQ